MPEKNDLVVATIREIAEAHGISIEGARLKVKRRAGKGLWRTLPSNHPSDPVRVELPRSELSVGPVTPPTPPTWGGEHDVMLGTPQSLPHTPTGGSPHDNNRGDPNELKTLAEVVQELSGRVEELTDRLIEAERAKAQVEVQKAATEKDAAIAQSEITHLVQQLDSLKSGHLAEMEHREKAFQDQLRDTQMAGDKQISDLKAIVDEMKARPWWRRLAG